jgi:DNA-binding FrmR family transcriptional regulator
MPESARTPRTPDTPCGQGACCAVRRATRSGDAKAKAFQEADMPKEVKDQEALKKDVMARMKRIEGQVRGIQRMIEEGKECEDILVQVRAVRSALRSATTQIMRRYLLRCNEQAVQSGDVAGQYEKLMKLVSDFIDG